MSTTPADFNVGEYVTRKNAEDALKRSGQVAPVEPPKPSPGKPAEPVAAEAATTEQKTAIAEDGDHQQRLSRSQRRRENQLLREIGELRGRLGVFESMLKPADGAQNGQTAEPDRAQFTTDAEYTKAVAKHAAAEVLASKTEEDEQVRAMFERAQAADAKAAEDRKLFEDWEDVAEDAQELEPLDPGKDGTLLTMIQTSEMKALVLYYFAKNPKEYERILEMRADVGEQTRAFGRLETKVEKLYRKEQAAQAAEAEKPKEDRKHLAEAEPKGDAGRTAADRDASKPRPSTSVAAPGGSSAPLDPAPGTREWMAMRNRAQFGR